jgi:anti-anti-sigma factor
MSGFALPTPFDLEDEVREGRRTLVLRGELDIAAAARLEAALRDVSANGTTAMTLDLSRLTFMDSTGLRAVLLAKEVSDSHGCELSIVPGPPGIQRIFELTALLDVLPWTDAAAATSEDERPHRQEAKS